MVDFAGRDDLQGATFIDTNLRGARFIRSDLSGAVLRGVDVGGVEIDAPWLLEDSETLLVNGVDVVPFVDAELNRRLPGRELRSADDPDGLRRAWAAVQGAWRQALDRVAAMPAGTVDVRVCGEWSFAETLRHLVMATDVWLRGAVHGVDQPYHPVGLPNVEFEADGGDLSVFSSPDPGWDEVLEARADRVGLVTAYLSGVTVAQLVEPRANPWAPQHPETVLSCLHTILGEEWEHFRYATRDLDAMAGGGA